MLHWLSRWGRRLWRSFCFPFQSRRRQASPQVKAVRDFPSSRGEAIRQGIIVPGPEAATAATAAEDTAQPPKTDLAFSAEPQAKFQTGSQAKSQAKSQARSQAGSQAGSQANSTLEADRIFETEFLKSAAHFEPCASAPRSGKSQSQSAQALPIPETATSTDQPFDWVLEHRIAIGPLPKKAWLTAFKAQGICAIISLCDESEGTLPKAMTQQFRCVRVSLPDSRYERSLTVAELEEAVDLLHWHVKKQQAVYLHCLAGIERSPLVAIAYLARYRAMDLLDAVGWLSHMHVESRPTSTQLKVVRQYLSQS